jgi:hypothetical protein
LTLISSRVAGDWFETPMAEIVVKVYRGAHFAGSIERQKHHLEGMSGVVHKKKLFRIKRGNCIDLE